MASQGGDDDNFPAPGGRYFTANNGLSGVIAALEDEIGLEGFDQFSGVSSSKTVTPSTKGN